MDALSDDRETEPTEPGLSQTADVEDPAPVEDEDEDEDSVAEAETMPSYFDSDRVDPGTARWSAGDPSDSEAGDPSDVPAESADSSEGAAPSSTVPPAGLQDGPGSDLRIERRRRRSWWRHDPHAIRRIAAILLVALLAAACALVAMQVLA